MHRVNIDGKAITGSSTFKLTFDRKVVSESLQLEYYCTSHSSMKDTIYLGRSEDIAHMCEAFVCDAFSGNCTVRTMTAYPTAMLLHRAARMLSTCLMLSEAAQQTATTAS